MQLKKREEKDLMIAQAGKKVQNVPKQGNINRFSGYY